MIPAAATVASVRIAALVQFHHRVRRASAEEEFHVNDSPSTPTMEIITDPGALASAEARRRQFERNQAWLEAHAREVFSLNRGRFYCTSGQELFVGETADAALRQARAAHPEDDGRFTGYIAREKMDRIYAN